ncbi:hypothetical protein RJ55_04557 [Drechmeria coniospora]|nr:hypothetical protein RJ55_04557 [Drechmeria coniospora]
MGAHRSNCYRRLADRGSVDIMHRRSGFDARSRGGRHLSFSARPRTDDDACAERPASSKDSKLDVRHRSTCRSAVTGLRHASTPTYLPAALDCSFARTRDDVNESQALGRRAMQCSCRKRNSTSCSLASPVGNFEASFPLYHG